MKEISIVRENLMTENGYAPYCGSVVKGHPQYWNCSSPRSRWDKSNNQFKCPECGWTSAFPEDFITRYKAKWQL